MREVVINACYGGFSLSHKAVLEYAKRKGIKLYPYTSDYSSGKSILKPFDGKNEQKFMCVHYYTSPLKDDKNDNGGYFDTCDIKRDDPDLVAVVKNLKGEANGSCANLKVVKIPEDVSWSISEYDGSEQVDEAHRTWG